MSSYIVSVSACQLITPSLPLYGLVKQSLTIPMQDVCCFADLKSQFLIWRIKHFEQRSVKAFFFLCVWVVFCTVYCIKCSHFVLVLVQFSLLKMIWTATLNDLRFFSVEQPTLLWSDYIKLWSSKYIKFKLSLCTICTRIIHDVRKWHSRHDSGWVKVVHPISEVDNVQDDGSTWNSCRPCLILQHR